MGERLPPWVKVPLPGGGHYATLKQRLRQGGLHTVCEEARCPNVAECWGGGTATFMILGKVCTRACRFCDVTSGKPELAPDPAEPAQVADAAAAMELRYVVITSVDRDDLPDGGAGHFVRTVEAVRQRIPAVVVELLTPDFDLQREPLERVARSGAQVLGQNLETVERLTRTVRDRRSGYGKTLEALRLYRELAPRALVKSSLLLGLGEAPDELDRALVDLRAAGVDWVTMGQYLRPTRKHLPVSRFVPPAEFEALASRARELGFPLVTAGPLVRSSYRAAEQEAQALLAARAG